MPPGRAWRRPARPLAEAAPPAGTASRFTRLTAWLDRHAAKFAVALILLASIRIVATYHVFSHTADETAHVACGMEWLDRGRYRYEPQHPPLARVAAAIGPYLLGQRSRGTTGHGTNDPFIEGIAIFYHGNDYDRVLSASRLGILPFFWIACYVVFAWARRDFGRATAVVALFLFTFLPPVLAHAGLATTDMALTAFLGAAFLAGRVWLETPTPRSGAVFGLSLALAILSKFSSLAYFPVAVVFALRAAVTAGTISGHCVTIAIRRRLPSFLLAIAVALFAVWAGYRFSFGRIDRLNVALPAPELFRGILDVEQHNATGHAAYLLGRVSPTGFLGYYFVVLAVKTPLAFLALIAGIVVFARREWRRNPALLLPAAYAAAIVAVSFFSRINIGVRHVLPVYTALSILAAAALLRLGAQADVRRWMAPTLAALLGWYAVASAAAHPDYLPYFNELAGRHPEKILVDSDLDWGQDLKRLLARLHEADARSLSISSLWSINVSAPGMPPVVRQGRADTPVAGWNAVAVTAWKTGRIGSSAPRPDRKVWPDLVPAQEIVGKSIYLWYFPPSAGLPSE